MKKGFINTALLVLLSANGTVLQAETAGLLKKTNGYSETELLLLKELAKMNTRLDKLNSKVVQLEGEKKQWKASQAKTVPVKVIPVKAQSFSTKSKSQGLRFAALDQQSSTRTDALPNYTQPTKPEVKQYVVESKTTIQYKTLKYVTPPPTNLIVDKDAPVAYLYLDKSYYNISPDQLNQTKYFQIINQNSPLSTANNNLCIKNALCFSALANFDLRYYDRTGGLDSIGESQIPSLLGVGVRPLFSAWDKNVIGSINNANLFVDGYVNPYVSAHMNLAYVNGSVKSRTFSTNDADWSTVYRGAAAVKMDEVFATLLVPNTPFFARIGRQYLNFGDNKPYPMTESLVQLLTQTRSGAFIGGFVLPNGAYASANYSMARISLDNLSNPLGLGQPGNKDRNFGGKIGFTNHVNEVYFDLNASYLYDMRDADYLNSLAYQWTYDLLNDDSLFARTLTSNQVYLMHRAPGIAAHADLHWRRFGVMGEFASALNRMDPANPNSRIRAWGLHGNVAFGTFGFASLADIGYERGYSSQVFQTVVYGPLPEFPGVIEPLQLGNALPKSRIVGTYSVALLPEVALSAQWVHDKDLPIALMGSNKSSDIGVLRVSVQL